MKDAKGYIHLNRSELEQCKVDSSKTRGWTTDEAKLCNKAFDPKYIGLTRKTKKRSGHIYLSGNLQDHLWNTGHRS